MCNRLYSLPVLPVLPLTLRDVGHAVLCVLPVLPAGDAADLEVRVGNTFISSTSPPERNPLCAAANDPTGSNTPFNITCHTSAVGMRGRYVSLQRIGVGSVLTLCEVEIFGFPTAVSPLSTNVALQKPAYSSGNLWNANSTPSKANDGDTRNVSYSAPFCSVFSGSEPWW